MSLCTATDIGAKGTRSITLLGRNAHLQWSFKEQGLVIQLPDENPGDFAHTLKISPRGPLVGR